MAKTQTGDIPDAIHLLLRWLVLKAILVASCVFCATPCAAAALKTVSDAPRFPPALDSYGDSHLTSVREIVAGRARQQPFNVVATLIFLAAIVHTALSQKFRSWAHQLEENGNHALPDSDTAGSPTATRPVKPWARLLHFLGEVEAIFGIWAVPLAVAMTLTLGAPTTRSYFHERLNFTEPIFVVVVMSIAGTRPLLNLAELGLERVARLGGGTPGAWWLSLLVVGPMLGSFITEPAAMTICAMLLSRKFYEFQPSARLAYATLGLLFVSISTGGTLTHFAAPPVLMVSAAWGWDSQHMLVKFGWKACLGVFLSALAYWMCFRRELRQMRGRPVATEPATQPKTAPWVTIGHLVLLALAVFFSHAPVYLGLLFLLFLAFTEITEEYQRDFSIRAPVLVGLFLAGLVIHGGLQQWWIAPVLGSLGEIPLFWGALGLTAFNDNAAITYLCTLVPTFTESMKHAAVAGAVVGGGLTVIANAPNPAGQAILGKHFQDGISVTGLFLGALLPTLIQAVIFLALR